MDAGWFVFTPAIALSGYAAAMVGGKAAFSVPIAIMALASSPGGQSALADRWETVYKELGDAHQQLQGTKKKGMPEEWDADDRNKFTERVDTLSDQIVKSKNIVHGTSQIMRHSSNVSWGAFGVCTAAAAAMAAAALAANAGNIGGPAAGLAARLAAMQRAGSVLKSLHRVMEKQRALALAASGILLVGTAWHEGNRQVMVSRANRPEGDKPDFKQVSLKWE
ncbi:hypothetical protein [Nonomuraea cavernae]|uniref:Uncharacterized protein n=1 Tax=Nonomuraea cavernae TaxID=2045107 RepID=A0A917ZHZ4_9ACTN|nr:hypothetical protein [Nonomuraea cavernae]MCA2190075.1 hypothetical protein [Nonomuraea cavernae]GGO83011.1 hypothetical protein GCM10012289_75580 [Nonomuraea cavernae]